MKCEMCNDKAKFSIKHLEKNEITYFCGVHFLAFCKEISSKVVEKC